MMSRLRVALLCLVLPLLALTPRADTRAEDEQPDPAQGERIMRACLVLPAVGGGGRSVVRVDPVELALIRGEFRAPEAGDKVRTWQGAEVEWTQAEGEHRIRHQALVGGYAFWQFHSEFRQTMILHARGHSMVYVNGVPRAGDMYDNGHLQLPVQLEKGTNDFLFQVGRGQVSAQLLPVPERAAHGVYLTGQDDTVPDLLAGQPAREYLGAAVVVNATPDYRRVSIHADAGGGTGSSVWSVPPMSLRKVPFTIHAARELEAGRVPTDLQLRVEHEGNWHNADTRHVELRVRTPEQRRNVTFRSAIDNSVQYYALVPALRAEGSAKPGIVLSLHGASVEATAQAGSYSPKSWCHIVCPTNRRPFGFDWEDWGRLDAMEVLAHAKATLEHDPRMVYLTGHSMGGHGTWTVGAHFPDKFAAIAPSAGWESFASYGGRYGYNTEYAMAGILNRATNTSRTLLLKHNYSAQGIYILHGDDDRTVPVTEARRMREVLSEFHNDLHYHEHPGGGHWWSSDLSSGADCVDWPPIFDLFARRRLPAASEVLNIDFTTACPGNNSDCNWASIYMQQVQLEPSRVQLLANPNARRVTGTTENVSRLVLRVGDILHVGDHIRIELDGTALEGIEWPESGRLDLLRGDEGWRVTAAPKLEHKGPHRYGMAKNAMRRHFVFVYGTGGDAAMREALFHKARFDAEQWYYRANGSVEVMPDSAFDPESLHGRDIVLYGNADNNSAFELVRHAPIKVRNGEVRIGDRRVSEAGLAVVYCYPRPDCSFSSVVVIGATCVQGVGLTNRLGYFISGAAFPDVVLLGPEMLLTGTGGVRAAGMLGEAWGMDGADIHWRPEVEPETEDAAEDNDE